MQSSKFNIEDFFAVLLAVVGILSLWHFFQDDSSRIVSKRGAKVLDDDKAMDEVNQQIEAHKSSNYYSEVVVNVD